MRNIRLTITYDGSRYQGWQRPGGNLSTISAKFNEVLHRMTQTPVDLYGGVKTEAGVHAIAQTASFQTESSLPTYEICSYLNHYLPQDIAVVSAKEAPERFHAALNARAKTYLYRIDCTPVENVFTRKYCGRLPKEALRTSRQGEPLPDIEAMRQSAKLLTGRYDFRNFSAGKSKKSTIKELFDVKILTADEIPEHGLLFRHPLLNADCSCGGCTSAAGTSHVSGGELQILLTGNDFLYRMPQLIIGTLLEIGTGKKSVSSIERIFNGEESVGSPCPPQGLYLYNIQYDPM